MSGLGVGIFLNLAIWPITFLVIFIASSKTSAHIPGEAAMLSGLGGIVLLLFIVLIIHALDSFGMRTFTVGIVISIWGAVVINIASLLVFSRLNRKPNIEPINDNFFQFKKALILTGIFAFGLVGFQVLTSIITPVQSWDGVDFWMRWARYFLVFDLDDLPIAGVMRSENQPFPVEHARHPLSAVYLFAYAGWVTSVSESVLGGWAFINVIGMQSVALILFGFSRSLGLNVQLALGVSTLFLTLPLFENQLMLVGYADIWVCILVTVSIACVAFGLNNDTYRWVAAGLVMGMTPIIFKNIGFLYSVAIFSSFIVCTVLPKVGFVRLALFLLSCALLGIVSIFLGFEFEVFGVRFAAESRGNAYVALGGYEMPFAPSTLAAIFSNSKYAFFVNSSFSIVCVCYSAALILPSRYGEYRNFGKGNGAFLFLTICPLFLLIALLAPQLNSVYADRFAAPGSDLGNSRFNLAAIGAMLLFIVASISKAQRPEMDVT